MRFNGNLDVDFGKWTQVKMERENNMKEFKGIDEEQPKSVSNYKLPLVHVTECFEFVDLVLDRSLDVNRGRRPDARSSV